MRDLKIFGKTVEEAKEQIDRLLQQEPFKDCKVRIMPDVHVGMGCVIGFTADLGDKVIPNIVGVDIGCGILTVEFGKIDINLKKLNSIIHKNIPSGYRIHRRIVAEFKDLQNLYCYKKLKNIKHIENSVGTLGGGNHFIEMNKDDEDNIYLVIHSGSRNLGKQVADYYQNMAITINKNKTTSSGCPNDLCFLDWNYSAPHGAGRLMSRTEARKRK